MTIGIAVAGPSAGRAALRALRAVETVGRGAIGGFVAFAAISSNGDLHRASCQRGGARALFENDDLPQSIAEARLAALMSSGPDRPEPLAQFVPAAGEVGIITGHRLPHLPGADGRPVNQIALDALASGDEPAKIVNNFQAANPDSDAGLVVMSHDGEIALGNSELVARRRDVGVALHKDAATGLRIGVLHNLIFPTQPLAELAVAMAIDAVAPADAFDLEIPIRDCPLALAARNALHLDTNRVPRRIDIVSERWLEPIWQGSALLRGAAVLVDGRLIGHIVREPYCMAQNGRITGGYGGDVASVRLISKD